MEPHQISIEGAFCRILWYIYHGKSCFNKQIVKEKPPNLAESFVCEALPMFYLPR